jgi:hypothetical protein
MEYLSQATHDMITGLIFIFFILFVCKIILKTLKGIFKKMLNIF